MPPLHYALVVALLSAAQVPAQEAESWVGKRVITRFGTVLRVGNRVVDDEGKRS